MSDFFDDDSAGMISDMGGEFAANSGTAAIPDDFEFDTSDASESDLATGGVVDKDGNYHFRCEKVDFNLGLLADDGVTPQTPHVKFTLVVLESVKGQSPAGSRLWHDVYVAQKDGSPAKKGSKDSMDRFCLGLGLMRWAEVNGERKLVSVATGLTKFKLKEMADAVGRHVCAPVKKDRPSDDPRFKDRDPRFSIPMGRAYHPLHPDVNGWQKNTAELIADGYMSEAQAVQAKSQKAAEKPAVNQTASIEQVAATSPAQSTGGDWDIDSL